MHSRRSQATGQVLLSLICLAAAFSALVSACSPSAPKHRAPFFDGERVFQEKSIGSFGVRGTYKVALTFDDGPAPGVTDALLDLLKAERVRATFFLVGDHVRANPELVKRIRLEGHVLGNHSTTHQKLTLPEYLAEPARVVSEISETHDLLQPLFSGQKRPYFRAPFGAWKAQHAAVLNAYPALRTYVGPIFWTSGGELKKGENGKVETAADWACWLAKNNVSVDDCADGYMNEIESDGGGVTLMHDTDPRTVELAKKIITRLKEREYTFVTLEDLAILDQYDSAP